ncbi:hypothetical protein ACHWQZ_G013519 [Mnemiopsis leidyi]
MAELERLVAQKTPLPGLWQHVLSDTMGTTLKSLNSAFSKYLMTPDISTISEIERLQIALQVCAFYNDLNNEEIAQNIMTLLIDNATKHPECLEFLSFMTSVAASSKCRLYLQTFSVQAAETTVTQSVCERIISDNCLNTTCYSDLYSIAKQAPQFILLLLRHALSYLIQAIIDMSELKVTVLGLALNLVEQNENFLSNSDILHSTLLCVIATPLVGRKKTKITRNQEIRDIGNFDKLRDKLFKAIFLKLSSTNDFKVDWEVLSQISDFIKLKERQVDNAKVENSKNRLNQIILILSHNRIPNTKPEKDKLIKLIQNNELGDYMLHCVNGSTIK